MTARTLLGWARTEAPPEPGDELTLYCIHDGCGIVTIPLDTIVVDGHRYGWVCPSCERVVWRYSPSEAALVAELGCDHGIGFLLDAYAAEVPQ